ncbi:MAG: sulfatase-like hydrolase/transferase, partial [Acidimicrobiia bacterium]
EGILAVFAIALPAVLILFVSTSASARLIWADSEPVAPSGVAVANPAPLVLITLDEFPVASIMDPDGTINGALFPNFARLANQGTWYRNALSNSIATTQSVPAILTGRMGRKELGPSAVDYPENLFTLLNGAYEMHVVEWVTELCPQVVCPDFAGRAPARLASLLLDAGVVYGHLTLPPTARERLPSIDNAWKGFLGQARVPDVVGGVEVPGLPVPPAGQRSPWVGYLQRTINGIDRDAPATLHFVHLQAPHVPWSINPSGTHYERPEEYTEVEGVVNGHWVDEPDPALLGFQRHLYQLGFVDTMLGRLMDRLEEERLWDGAMVIVVADHGASFVPGQHRRWPYEDNRDDLYRVPLFVKYPGEESGEVVNSPAFTIDIVPTIVDVLGVETDWEFDGISLLDVPGTNRPHEVTFWCCNRNGVSTDLQILVDQVERNRVWIPDQSSWLGVASVGSYGTLVGRSVEELTVEPNPDLRWTLDLGASLGDVDRSSGFVQTLITGRAEVPAGVTSNDILVVLNGYVAGVGYLVRDSAYGGALRGLVAEELVSNGPNEIDVLVPNPDGTGFYSGTVADLTLRLTTEDGRLLQLRREGGRRIEVKEAVRDGASWTVEGWAADVVAKEVPDWIYVFAGEALVASGPPNRDDPNVVRWFGSKNLLRSGFSFSIDATRLPPGIAQLTVVAEFGSVAVADSVRLQG